MASSPRTLLQLVDSAVATSGLTRTAWCVYHAINPRMIYRWLAGEMAAPQVKSMAKVARAAGVEFVVMQAAVMRMRRRSSAARSA